MKKFTVLLLLPDYVAETYGHSTYLAWVKASNHRQAVKKARLNAHEVCARANYLEDYFVLFMVKGHQVDLNPGDPDTEGLGTVSPRR